MKSICQVPMWSSSCNLYQVLRGYLVACVLLLPYSCTQSTPKDKDESQVNKISKFIPNPQFIAQREVSVMNIGESAVDFNLPGTDGEFHSLDEYKDAQVLAIIFTCNHCPTAQAYEDRLIKLVDDYQDKSFQLIAISPNSPVGLLYEELGYTDLNDDYQSMILRSEYLKYNFPYLYDGDTEEISLKYGPVATPHAFVFDTNRKLTYQGRIDGSEKPGTANADDLRKAIDATLNRTKPEPSTTKVFGCSTKWGWKNEYRAKADASWLAKPVGLEIADVEKIQSVVANEGGDKLRLINVWATWCGPCIIEYPEFLALQRMYGARDFEFVSISADKPNEGEKALKFLTEKHSPVKNYLFSLEDKYALIEAVDPDWNGALPYTMLVDDMGEKVWAHQGQVDFLALKRAIVDHPLIGRYY